MFLYYDDVAHDSRVLREARELARSGRRVHVIGLGSPDFPDREEMAGFEVLRVGAAGRLRPGHGTYAGGLARRFRWLTGYLRGLDEWARAAAAAAIEATAPYTSVAWHGHDLSGVIAAHRAAKERGGRLVYDSHELFMGAGSAARLPGPARRMLAAWEGRLARRSDLVITVNESIATTLARAYRIPRPTIVMNCPEVTGTRPARLASPLRTEMGLGARPVILHHGVLGGGKGIMETVAALEHLPGEVALVLLGEGDLLPELRKMALEPRYRDRLFLHESVSVDELPDWVVGADVGVMAFQPIAQNNIFGTPNKLFECMAVGVPVVVSDFPEMGRIVRETGVGETCDPADPASIARSIRTVLDHPRERYERASAAAVADKYSWVRQAEILVSAYDRIQPTQH